MTPSSAVNQGTQISTYITTCRLMKLNRSLMMHYIALTFCKDIFFINASSKQRCILLFISRSRSISVLPVIRCTSFKGVATILLAGDRAPWSEPGVLVEGSGSGSEWSALRTYVVFEFKYTGWLTWIQEVIQCQLNKALHAWNQIDYAYIHILLSINASLY